MRLLWSELELEDRGLGDENLMRYEDSDFRKDDKVSAREEKLPEAGKMFLLSNFGH